VLRRLRIQKPESILGRWRVFGGLRHRAILVQRTALPVVASREDCQAAEKRSLKVKLKSQTEKV